MAFISLVLLFFMTVVSDFQCKSNTWKKKSKKSRVQPRVMELCSRQQVLASPSCSFCNEDALQQGITETAA